MRRKDNTQNISAIIKKLMNNPKLDKRLEQLDMIDVWNDYMGNQFKKYIDDVSVHKNILCIKLNSAALRNELSYQKSAIIQEINDRIGKEVLLDLTLK